MKAIKTHKTMKLKIGKKGNEYYSGVYYGSGGISSCVNYRQGGLWFVIGAFKFKNLWDGLIGKHKKGDARHPPDPIGF